MLATLKMTMAGKCKSSFEACRAAAISKAVTSMERCLESRLFVSLSLCAHEAASMPPVHSNGAAQPEQKNSEILSRNAPGRLARIREKPPQAPVPRNSSNTLGLQRFGQFGLP